MRSVIRRVALASALAIPAPAAVMAQAGPDCRPSGGLEFVCGPRNAEDLVLVPGTRWIIASTTKTDSAAILLIDSRARVWSKLYPSEGSRSQADATGYGGCPGAPATATLMTHGLHLRPGTGGHSTLYAVAHGGRESIEVFDVDANGAKPALTWKGCVLMPAGLAANSVASSSDGSVVATVLMHPGHTFADVVAGKPTGAVYRWTPGSAGFELLKGTELPGNNGIEVSADGREIFVASTGLRTVVAYSNSNPATRLRTTRPMTLIPDNLHFAPDGRLLTAGTVYDEPGCGGVLSPTLDLRQFASCPRGFLAVAVDPRTMGDRTIAQGSANPHFSNASTVLLVGKEYWIGVFSGDRVGYGTVK